MMNLEKALNKAQNFQPYMTENPAICYPLQAEQLTELNTACNIEMASVYVPKNQVAETLAAEIRAADELLQTITQALSADGFSREAGNSVADKRKLGSSPRKNLASRTEKLSKDFAGYERGFTSPLAIMWSKLLCEVTENRNTLAADLKAEERGQQGEAAVVSVLKRFPREIAVLENVILPDRSAGAYGPKTAEMDALVISPTGIFVIEVKNWGYNGETLHIRANGSWALENHYNGRMEEITYSPFEQNARHCAVLSQFLEGRGFGGIPVMPVQVIANDEVALDNTSGMTVIRCGEIRETVYRKISDTFLQEEQIRMLKAALEEACLPPRKFPVCSISKCRNAPLETANELQELRKVEAVWSDRLVQYVNKEFDKARIEEGAPNIDPETDWGRFRLDLWNQPIYLPYLIITCILTVRCLPSWFIHRILWDEFAGFSGFVSLYLSTGFVLGFICSRLENSGSRQERRLTAAIYRGAFLVVTLVITLVLRCLASTAIFKWGIAAICCFSALGCVVFVIGTAWALLKLIWKAVFLKR